jgi:hypothetical protein
VGISGVILKMTMLITNSTNLASIEQLTPNYRICPRLNIKGEKVRRDPPKAAEIIYNNAGTGGNTGLTCPKCGKQIIRKYNLKRHVSFLIPVPVVSYFLS